MVQNQTYLQNHLRQFFTPVVQGRGVDYARFRFISNLQVSSAGASATVAGNDPYEVSLKWETVHRSRRVRASCSCAHFTEGNFCKHLWALIVTADESGKGPRHWPSSVELVWTAPEPTTAAVLKIDAPVPSAALVPERGWRALFQAETPTYAPPTEDERAIYVVMRKSPRHPEMLSFMFYQMAPPNNGPSPNQSRELQRLRLPQTGALKNAPAAAQALLKILNGLAQTDRNPFSYNRSQAASETERLVSQEQTPFLLKTFLHQIPIFTSDEHLLAHLRKQGAAPLELVQAATPQLVVSETATGFELDATVSAAEDFLSSWTLFAPPSVYLKDNKVCIFDSKQTDTLFEQLKSGPLPIPADDIDGFLEAVLNQNITIQLPESLRWPETVSEPTARIQLTSQRAADGRGIMIFDLRLQYRGNTVSYLSPQAKFVNAREKTIELRDKTAEERILKSLPVDLLTSTRRGAVETLSLTVKNLAEFVQRAVTAGVPVEIDSKNIQTSSAISFSVSSGVDWFDVEAQADFSGLWLKFPAILEAARKGDILVPLGDNQTALIDDALLKKINRLAALAETRPEGLRFQSSQGVFLNSLLADDPSAHFDDSFKRLQEKIKTFSALEASEPVPSFKGTLREYQKEGLGWLEFLDAFGLGGILADDMGLGKTVQCLAFLEGRRIKGEAKTPSLIIAPKSLLSNWESEAATFAPNLKVHISAGSLRHLAHADFDRHDIIIMTYQTMLRDLAHLKERRWDCVILDEAQAIKNPGAQISKAAKLLPAKFRLAMTGTPIENSIQDLFSISDFVNPGFLAGRYRSAHLQLDEDTRGVLLKALKPVLLRRTKSEVLKDLPAKTEQTITVELEQQQLKTYNQLKRYYQVNLVKEVEQNGVKKSQIQILAALTRLRQAALHPGLIDPALLDMKSSKLEEAYEMLEEIMAEGHRVLIFSQFVSLLSIVKSDLTKKGIAFSYLDGKTTDRKAVLDDFKSSTKQVFLISLKAGGTGLNLVEANYVFLLDPWWNPSVETQAIDRVHRIGQKQAVNAYRFIAKDTVEEKILELQKLKKRAANDLLDTSESLVRSLSATDIAAMFA